MKKLLAFVLLVMIICSCAGCDSEKKDNEDNGGFEKIDVSELPSKLDLRDLDGMNYVTPVKTQLFGDCWAMAMAAAAETSYLYANDMGVDAGLENKQVDFSEKYISWYVFHGMTREDVKVGRVRASQIGEGFDPSEAEKDTPVISAIFGGAFVGNVNLFGAGFGPVDESLTVNGEKPYSYDDMWSGEWTLPQNAEYRCADSDAILRNAIKLPSPAQHDKDGAYSFDQEGVDAIKYELNKGHAVTIGVYSSHVDFGGKSRHVYYEGEDSVDHAVAIIGYDDDYPKERFTRKGTGGDTAKDITPPENGAFIIKNSWGLSGDPDDDGYLWLSYYDQSIKTPLSYSFDNSKKAAHTARNIDQYDLLMTQWYATVDREDEFRMANVFDAEGDESLYQIAYMTTQSKTEVSYEIYQGIDDGDPASGELLEKGECRHTYPGYYTVDLADEYKLRKGDKYAVVLTMKHTAGEDDVYSEVFPYSTQIADGIKARAVVNKGESYLWEKGSWTDLSRMIGTHIDIAFEQIGNEIGKKERELPIKLDSKDTFVVDNYPIKAILAESK